MITDGEKCNNLAVKSLSRLLHGITSKHDDDHYRMNCLYSFKAGSKLISHENVCKNHDYCNKNA